MTAPAPKQGRWPWVFGVVLVGAVVGTAWAARAAEGRRSLAAAASAGKQGDRALAIVLARAAAEARCPFCQAPELACGLLDAIAKDAEAHGDDATAVASWRAIRAATLSTSVLQSGSARRALADAEIARLEHRIEVASAAAAGTPVEPGSEEKLRDVLAATSVPSGAVFAVTGMGAALFLLGAVRFARALAFQPTSLALALAGGALAAAGLLFF